ncbi:hypothetical protein MKY51_12025 [Solibacillus sp. FSL R5-0691]|uniref:FOG: GAF domain n=1 Tax=Solibacillus silvestris (strain StLB046) TaxID=1002809 RepID=F2FA36_SOLSS|nr:hypothetical protein [Solibacillus silvestris]BAK15702.1 FOG: GAF domain [Solibacillus silvestris StLB046]
MNKFILNHGCFVDIQKDFVLERFKELTMLINFLREKDCVISITEDLWSINVEGSTLQKLVHERMEKDTTLVTIITVMNSGPYFQFVQNFDGYEELITNPKVLKNTFEYNYLYSNVLDNCFPIISFENPKYITEDNYVYNVNGLNGDISNYLGLSKLEEYFLNSLRFSNISEVFEKINEEFPNIKILSSAIKSAQRHNFQGNQYKVYEAFKGLNNFERLPAMSGEQREERFYEATKMKISPETKATMDVDRYKKQRTFSIPGKQSEIFEWHVKIGNNTRIHYYFDEEDDIIYIGHCGKHLGTVSYKS